ncbi:carbohydrate kinase family protein [Candidatus Saccharibacteria bacterium]|jgi:ribokinase|nr:carbohydrate kinase family protein [Candidatus Saccharibacteria bacterium]
MAGALQKLLNNNSPNFTMSLHALERSTGRVGVDVRLIGDVLERSHSIVRQLGLDTADTTSRELYMALNSYVAKNPTAPLLIDADYLLWGLSDEIVSLNLIDVIENYHHQLRFEDRSLGHARRALRGELLTRYHSHPATIESGVNNHALSAGIMLEEDEYHKSVTKLIKTENNMNNDNNKPYVLAVGDIISDDFIKLSEEHAEVTEDEHGYKRISFELGAKLPYDSVEKVEAVECSPNAAVSMTRLGLETSLMSWLGDDEAGKGMISYLKSQSVGTNDLVVEAGMKSNYHYVLRYGADRTKLQKFEDYSYQWKDPARKPDWLYLGVLGENTWPLHEEILGYLEQNQDVRVCFQPGMYHLMWGIERMKPFYLRAEIVILNREEAAEVTGVSREDMKGLLQAMHDLGVNVIVITDGPDGAYASDGQQMFSMPNYPDPADPFDRTGAGDAFASTITAALALGESLEAALLWAPINSMSVVQKLGAQAGLLNRDELQSYLDNAPEWYHPSSLE